jgi:hypothetical protein
MSKQETYRHNAAKCLEMADKTSDVAIRIALVDMAHVWLRLAEQAEKNSHLDLVYETPRHRDQASSGSVSEGGAGSA